MSGDNGAKHLCNRRDILRFSGLGLGAIAAGKVLSERLLTSPEVASHSLVYAATTFYKGCDISYAEGMSNDGYNWKNSSGQTESLLTILKGYGINAIRLRTFVDPPQTDHLRCDQAQTIAAAVNVKNAGMAVMIDFHFGDTFNSVGKQDPPAAWANYSYSEMVSALGNYVYNFCEALKAKGVTPTWIQMGNEINSGLCHPVGELSKPSQMTGLIMESHKIIKEVFPGCLTIIHLAQPQNGSSISNFFNAYQNNGGQWDITGFSSYATGSEIPGVINAMHGFQSQYGRTVMQVETGSPSNNPSAGKSYLSEYISGVGGFGGMGVFYWEPEIYPPFATSSETNSAWGRNREPLETMQGFFTNP